MLGVAENATLDEIKAAYRRQALQTHPDLHAGRQEAAKDDEKAGEPERPSRASPSKEASDVEFRAVQEAYQVLKNPNERARYDALRRLARYRGSVPESLFHQRPGRHPPSGTGYDEYFRRVAAQAAARTTTRERAAAAARAWREERLEAERERARHKSRQAAWCESKAQRQVTKLRRFWQTSHTVTKYDVLVGVGFLAGTVALAAHAQSHGLVGGDPQADEAAAGVEPRREGASDV